MRRQYKSGKTLNKAISIITILSALALGCSYLARFIDPQSFWPPAFAGLAYVPLLFLNVFLLVLNSIRRKPIAILTLLVILTGWNVFFDTFSFRPGSSPDQKPPLHAIRLFTWNVHYFENIDGPSLPSFQNEMLALVASVNPDVICMQEFSAGQGNQTKGKIPLQNRINMPYVYFQPMESSSKGMAVFSKYPIIHKGLLAFSNELSGNQCLFTDILKEGKIFRVYTVHLESIRLQATQLDYIDSMVKGKERNIRPSKKIAGQLKRAFQRRSEQVKLVKLNAALCPYPYLICGDFNDPPSSYAFYRMSSGLKNTFAEKGHGFFPVTYYKGFLKYQIDHILVSPAFEVLDHQIIKKKLSDHYPVFTDVRLR